jgi:hypothetical protein
MNIQFSYYYKAGTSGKALKCHIFQLVFMAQLFTDQSVLYQTAVVIIRPVELAKRGFSLSV